MSPSKRTDRRCGGFTLIELIVTLVVAAVIAAMVGMFIRLPIMNYVDANRRARLTDIADSSLRRMARDLHAALPFSARCASSATTESIEFFPVVGGGRYRERAKADGSGTPLLFGSAVSSFDALGNVPLEAGNAARYVVVGNLDGSGASSNSCDAYFGDNIASLGGVAGSNPATVSVSNGAGGGFSFPVCADLSDAVNPDPNQRVFGRFFIVESPVKYVCDRNAQTLTRYSGYNKGGGSWAAAAPVANTASAGAPAGGGALLAEHVSDCSFVCNDTASATSSTVSLWLQLSQEGDTVQFTHQVHAVNLP